MAIRSRVSPRFFVNELATAMSDDWATSYALMKYQMAKESSIGGIHLAPNMARVTMSNW